MSTAVDSAALGEVPAGSHVCWIVGEDDYVTAAATVLRTAADRGEKPVVFGPDTSLDRMELAASAAIAVDPRTAFLAGGPLNTSAMLNVFEEQTAFARAEGYRGLAVVADMDWLVPSGPRTAEVAAFELLLDRQAKALGATIVCAYRRSSFDKDAIVGALCVHPIEVGAHEEPQFRIVATDTSRWRLSGEVDYAVSETFDAVIKAALSDDTSVELDLAGLRFIDVAGIRAIAEAARSRTRHVQLVNAPRIVRQSWELSGFSTVAPSVELVA